jgi:glycosyltransferase involved in cell wall biosynthesis
MDNYLNGILDLNSTKGVWSRLQDKISFEIIENNLVESPLLSLVITNYNNQGYIPRLLNSIRDQEFPADKLEVLVIDDNSQDASVDMFRDSQLGNLRILKLNTNSGNHSIPSNLGVFLSRAKYVSFIDSDDSLYGTYALRHALDSVVGKKSFSVSDVLIHKDFASETFSWVDDLDQVDPGKFVRRSAKYSALELMEKCYAIGLRTFNKDCFLEVGGWEEKLGQHCDFGLLVKAAANFNMSLNPHICYNYFIHNSNISHNSECSIKEDSYRRDFVLKILKQKNITYAHLVDNASPIFWDMYAFKPNDL